MPPVFKGLVTGCNEIGEVRINWHVFSDAQDQLKVILHEFKETTSFYGQPDLQHFITDKPKAEKKCTWIYFHLCKRGKFFLITNTARLNQIFLSVK